MQSCRIFSVAGLYSCAMQSRSREEKRSEASCLSSYGKTLRQANTHRHVAIMNTRRKPRLRFTGSSVSKAASASKRRAYNRERHVEKTMQLSQGEKLILLMLCEIQEHLKLKGETNTELVKQAIYSGNLWGLDWGMPGVFHGSEIPDNVVREMANILS